MTAREVVTNSGPLMVLSKLNILYLLTELYGRVRIPEAVYNETVVEGIRRGFSDAYTLRLFLDQNNWRSEGAIQVREASQLSLLTVAKKKRLLSRFPIMHCC